MEGKHSTVIALQSTHRKPHHIFNSINSYMFSHGLCHNKYNNLYWGNTTYKSNSFKYESTYLFVKTLQDKRTKQSSGQRNAHITQIHELPSAEKIITHTRKKSAFTIQQVYNGIQLTEFIWIPFINKTPAIKMMI